MKITFCGAAQMVTGSCYLLEYQDKKFLVDCGMFQGNKKTKENNYSEFPFDPKEIDFVLLTHAHIDHSGLIPKLAKHGYHNPIYASSATISLVEIMLPDSGYIQEMEIVRKNKRLARAGKPLLEPIYTADDAEQMLPLFSAIEYDQTFSPVEGIEITPRNAGHILGSSIYVINYEENGETHTITFTGDLGRNDQAIVQDPFQARRCDFLVMESTYGNRLHSGGFEAEKPNFAKLINDTMRSGGNVIIPAFAVDRTQDILMMLYEMQEDGLIEHNDIYVDSPLAIKATEIFASYPEYFDKATTKLFMKEGKAPFILDNLSFSMTTEESIQLNRVKSGAIIISASGMADAGRIKHHLKNNLWRRESSVVFFGYQAEGTLGRRLINGETKVTIHGESVEVKARIFNMDGFSAHADYKEILEWLGEFKELPGQIFITHGDLDSAEALAQRVKERYRIPVVIPSLGDTFDLAVPGEEAAAKMAIAPDITCENMISEIATSIDNISSTHDIEKLMRIRDYLKSFK